MNPFKNFTLVLILSISTAACAQVQWPRVNSAVEKDPAIEKQVSDILKGMSTEEKVAQMIQAEIKNVSPEDFRDFPLGSILNGGGSFPNNDKYSKVSDWLKVADQYYEASTNSGARIPAIWGTDAVHGHNNVFGATIYPHNIGLGAANNPALLKEIAQATTLEVLATGIDWVFAPTVAVAQNDRWGRTYESYSEDAGIVRRFAKSFVEGMQGTEENVLNEDHLVSTVKHFVGDGGTHNGIDQGNNLSSEEELLRVHAQGYLSALKAGAQTVMASFNSWQGEKIHGNKHLLTDVLKRQMGFDGFVIGDWNGHGQVKGCTNSSCPQAINAGVDMIMVPNDWKAFYYNTLGQVRSGEIRRARVDDAVKRILRVKIRAGLLNNTKPSERKHAGNEKLIGAKEHRAIARRAVSESLVLLKNKKNLLPLSPKSDVLVVGAAADSIGQQSGGWTLSWQGTGNQNSDFPGGTSIWDGIVKTVSSAGGKATYSPDGSYDKKPDVAIVVFGETPYAEGQGDLQSLLFSDLYKSELENLKKLKSAGIPTVSIFITGRPLWVNAEINASTAFVVAWLPGTEGVGVSDVIFKNKNGKVNKDFVGKLSFSWPNYANQIAMKEILNNDKPAFALGYGLDYQTIDTLQSLPEVPFPYGNTPGNDDEIVVFAGRTLKPYRVFVGDTRNSRYELSGGVGTSPSGSVNVIAIDKVVQEDARQITFKADSSSSSYFFEANYQMNIESYLNSNGAISFDLRVDEKPQNEAFLSVAGAKTKVTRLLSQSEFSKWKTFSISLECFSDRGADLSKFNQPLKFSTDGKLKLSLANIKIISDGKETIDCSDLE